MRTHPCLWVMGLAIVASWRSASATAEDQLEAVTDAPRSIDAPPIADDHPPIDGAQWSRVLQGLRAHLRAARLARDAERVAQLEDTLRRVETGDISEEEFAFVAKEVAAPPNDPMGASDLGEAAWPDRAPQTLPPHEADSSRESLRAVIALAREKDPDLAIQLERELERAQQMGGGVGLMDEAAPSVPSFQNQETGAIQIRPIDLALTELSPELRGQLDAFLDREGVREDFEQGTLLPPTPAPASYDE